MKLFELTDKKKTFWEVLPDLGIDEDVVGEFHDKQLPWVNSNSATAVDKLIKIESYRTISQLRIYVKHVLKKQNFADKVLTAKQFLKALDTPIKVWRGGSGVFNPALPNRNWVSATLSKDRANTFSMYDGTNASRAVFLQKRSAGYWIVEIECKLKDILLYMHAGPDNEVIIPKTLQASATILVQK